MHLLLIILFFIMYSLMCKGFKRYDIHIHSYLLLSAYSLCLCAFPPHVLWNSSIVMSKLKRTISQRLPPSTTMTAHSHAVVAITNTPTIELVSQQVKNAATSTFAKELGELQREAMNTMVFVGRAEFGDYQCNLAIPLAKQLKMQPREVAQRLADAIMSAKNPLCPTIHKTEDLDAAFSSVSSSSDSNSSSKRARGATVSVIDKVDISGPGFINIHLSRPYLHSKLQSMLPPSQASPPPSPSQLRSPLPTRSEPVGSLTPEQQQQGVVDSDHSSSRSSSSSSSTLRVGIAPVAKQQQQRIVVDFSSPNIAKEMHVVRRVCL
jgi:hypothetical protein